MQKLIGSNVGIVDAVAVSALVVVEAVVVVDADVVAFTLRQNVRLQTKAFLYVLLGTLNFMNGFEQLFFANRRTINR